MVTGQFKVDNEILVKYVCTRLSVYFFTTSLWSLLLKSKTGCVTLNLLRISLCLAMSVARIHLEKSFFIKCLNWTNIDMDEANEDVSWSLTWLFLLGSVCTARRSGFSGCCTLAAKGKSFYNIWICFQQLQYEIEMPNFVGVLCNSLNTCRVKCFVTTYTVVRLAFNKYKYLVVVKRIVIDR